MLVLPGHQAPGIQAKHAPLTQLEWLASDQVVLGHGKHAPVQLVPAGQYVLPTHVWHEDVLVF